MQKIMRINNNITAINSHRQYGINNRALSRNVETLSSGFRVNRAGDDAAGLAISEKMRSQIRGLNMASRNSQDAISLVQTAEGGMQTVQDILQRMRELAVQSASDTNQNVLDREALQAEFDQLRKEINEIANTTEFNERSLLNGDFATTPLTIQAGANANQVLTINIGALTAGPAGLNIGALTVANRPDASAAIGSISRAIDAVSMQRANIGAMQNRLEFKIQNLDNQAENIAAAESRIRDVDMARAMTDFTRNNILFQASTAMLAQANALPQGVLQLLG
jgi:flagellin